MPRLGSLPLQYVVFICTVYILFHFDGCLRFLVSRVVFRAWLLAKEDFWLCLRKLQCYSVPCGQYEKCTVCTTYFSWSSLLLFIRLILSCLQMCVCVMCVMLFVFKCGVCGFAWVKSKSMCLHFGCTQCVSSSCFFFTVISCCFSMISKSRLNVRVLEIYYLLFARVTRFFFLFNLNCKQINSGHLTDGAHQKIAIKLNGDYIPNLCQWM